MHVMLDEVKEVKVSECQRSSSHTLRDIETYDDVMCAFETCKETI